MKSVKSNIFKQKVTQLEIRMLAKSIEPFKSVISGLISIEKENNNFKNKKKLMCVQTFKQNVNGIEIRFKVWWQHLILYTIESVNNEIPNNKLPTQKYLPSSYQHRALL